MEKTPKKNAGKKASEPVTKCDQSNKVVAICDQLNNEVEIMPIEEIDIAKLIVVIRDQQVLIDRDLAMLYGVETKHLNERVKRNVARFPERFRFQLTRQEMKELVAKYDRLKKLRHSTSLSYAFTEQGISMLSAVLASQTAVDTSIRIMDAFVGMRRYQLWMLLLVCVATSLQMLTYFSALIIWKCNNLRIKNGKSKQTKKLTLFLIRWMPTPQSF